MFDICFYKRNEEFHNSRLSKTYYGMPFTNENFRRKKRIVGKIVSLIHIALFKKYCVRTYLDTTGQPFPLFGVIRMQQNGMEIRSNVKFVLW